MYEVIERVTPVGTASGRLHTVTPVGYVSGDKDDGYRVSTVNSVEYDSIYWGGEGIGYRVYFNTDNGPQFQGTVPTFMAAITVIMGKPNKGGHYRFKATRDL